MMRPVKAKVYKNREWKDIKGDFHQWANATEESREGFVNYTVAIIECPDGQVEVALPQDVTFLDKLKEAKCSEQE